MPAKPIAVVDLGSNSMRLVVYDRPGRAPLPVYNTKVTSRLGKGLGETGRLNPEGVELALHGLGRFARLIKALDAEPVLALATAAVRAAEDGHDFVAEAERRLGRPIRVIDGAEEARLSALGVVSSLPRADGVVADLGGGSLELVAVHGGELGTRVSLPFGCLTLMDRVDRDVQAARGFIDGHLAAVEWLQDRPGGSLYAVGGAWRALARVHVEETGYPLPIVQGLSLPAGVARDLARRLTRFEPEAIAKLPGVSRRRAETVPHAALVLRRVIAAVKPNTIAFSAFGLREGALFDALPEEVRALDPLLAACDRIVPPDGVRHDLATDLVRWTDPLFPDEASAETRLRRAACRLADVAWQEHPAVRAEIAFRHVFYAHALAVPHEERAFLALAVFHRYGGRKAPDATAAAALLSEKAEARARVLGVALRLASKLTAGDPRLLAASGLRAADGALGLVTDEPRPWDEGIDARLDALAKTAGLRLDDAPGARLGAELND